MKKLKQIKTHTWQLEKAEIHDNGDNILVDYKEGRINYRDTVGDMCANVFREFDGKKVKFTVSFVIEEI